MKIAMGAQRQMALTGTDPEAAKRSVGGVGFAAAKGAVAREARPYTEPFQSAASLGRAHRALLGMGRNRMVAVYNVYLWPGGHESKQIARRSNSILQAVREEIAAHGRRAGGHRRRLQC